MLFFLRYFFRRNFLWTLIVWIGLSLAGYACAILSVHGPDFFPYLGILLLFPNYALANSGSPRSIFFEINLLNVLIFFLLQFLYFGAFDLLSIGLREIFSSLLTPPKERQRG
jgi:hypothetical protein